MRALVSTLPKSGTHLINLILWNFGLTRLHRDLTQLRLALAERGPASIQSAIGKLHELAIRSGDDVYLLDHIPYNSALLERMDEDGVQMIALIRDPRDFVVSFSHHAVKHPSAATQAMVDESTSIHHLQHLLCKRRGSIPSVLDKYLSLVDGWTQDPRVLTLRFEDIVGPQGGASILDQLATGKRLADFLGLDLSLHAIAEAMNKSFNPTIDLFRRGQVKAWRTELHPAVVDMVWSEEEELIGRWGYGRDGEVVNRPSADVPDLFERFEEVLTAFILENGRLKADRVRLKAEIVASKAGLQPAS